VREDPREAEHRPDDGACERADVRIAIAARGDQRLPARVGGSLLDERALDARSELGVLLEERVVVSRGGLRNRLRASPRS
jgi:hypothetical protein